MVPADKTVHKVIRGIILYVKLQEAFKVMEMVEHASIAAAGY